jgi:hypothetical protein
VSSPAGPRHPVFVFDWAQAAPGLALRLMPPFALVLLAGLLLERPQEAAIMASGALVVGFGAFQQFTASRAGPMLFAALGTALSALVGTLAGNSDLAMVLAALLYGFWCGLLPAIGMGAFWVGQQCAIYLIIAGAYAGGWDHALARAALIAAGGLVQILCFAAILWIERRAAPRIALRRVLGDGALALSGFAYHIRLASPYFHFAVRFAVVLAAAVGIERAVGIPNGYWIAMTALILMRPDFQDTLARCLGRFGGTVGGAVLATLIAHVLTPQPYVLAILVTVFAFCSYASLRFNYSVFALFLTGYVVFLLVLAGLAEPQVAAARIVSTLIGGAFALAAHLDFYLRRRARRQAT